MAKLGFSTTALQALRGADLTNKVAIVTGGNSGLGTEVHTGDPWSPLPPPFPLAALCANNDYDFCCKYLGTSYPHA